MEKTAKLYALNCQFRVLNVRILRKKVRNNKTIDIIMIAHKYADRNSFIPMCLSLFLNNEDIF